MHSTREQSFDWVCHELRKPISAMRAFAELLHDELSGGLNAEQQEQVATILRGADRAEEMIDDLYHLGEASFGNAIATFAEEELEAFCACAQDAAAPAFAERQVRLALESSGPLRVVTSADALRGALHRALRAALGASAAGDVVRMRLEPSHDGATVSIETARGDARGIDAVDEPWFAAPDRGRNTEHGGLGADVRICGALASAIGGSLQVRNGAYGGVRIAIEVPRSEPSRDARSTMTNAAMGV